MSDAVLEAAGASELAIEVTPAAMRQVRFLMQKQGGVNSCLRIGVKGGGCSGLSYVLGLEAAPTERDHVLNCNGLTVLVDKKSAQFVARLCLDYSVKNLLEGGWKFSNPDAARSCGCGTSFTPK